MVGRDTFWQQKFGKRLRFLALCSVYVKQIAYGIMQYNKNDTTPSSPGHRHQKKLTTVFRVVKPAVGGVKLSPSVKQVPLSPFPRKRAPRRLPPAGGTSRSRSRELFLIVSLVFGAAHCAMQNSRKLRTVCSCSTLYNTPPV